MDPPIHATMVRDERYKLTVYHGEDRGELYDMDADPDELDDLFDREEAAPVRLRLTAYLAEWLGNHERSGLGTRGGESVPGPADRLSNAYVKEES